MEGAYHGDTSGAISVGHLDEFHHYFARISTPGFRSTMPYCYRCPLGLQYPSCESKCVESALDILQNHGDKIAAVIVEPLVLGAGGMVIYPAQYLNRLFSAAREKGILIIVDEVFTGFGRTGSFFAFQQLDCVPDMVCLSKGLTSGMLAMGATLATREIFDVFTGEEKRKFYHGHTFTANALACAVANENLNLFERESVLEKNRPLIDFMHAQSPRFKELPVVGDVRQLGMIWAVELVQDRATRARFEPANAKGWQVATRAWANGIWFRPMGSSLYVVPPYCSTQADLQNCFDALYTELKAV